MKRRKLFGGLAAIAAAIAVAPRVGTVEAAPVEQMPTLSDGEVWVLSSEVAEARAEGYERGRAVAEARAESRAGTWITPEPTLPPEAYLNDDTYRIAPILT